MFDSLRLLVLSFLYYFGFAYAAFTALKQRSTRIVVAESSVTTLMAANARCLRTKVSIDIPSLKLMIMLTSMALLSLLGADWFPLFAEMRVIFMYTLLFAPPLAQQELYDQLFAPLLAHAGTVVRSPKIRGFFSRKVPLFLVRLCVDVAIAFVNYTQRSRSLDGNAAQDILRGLQFSQRALQQVPDVPLESEGATHAHSARDSSGAADIKNVRRALIVEKATKGFNAHIPLGRVVRDNYIDPESSLSVATASLSTMSPFSSTRGDGLLTSLHSEYLHSALEGSGDSQTDDVRRGCRNHKKVFGIS
ncbi:hypothetical protein, unknown function [Leishmania braziliensis MHOM/BR/75/M2904]|uniref:Uncharacterized protein n=2 Tax=Leishmania braziliensis TaxID=5660 RepID=A4HN86_LEIBR|nr:hypothetical protein, unknown function [Leishmania braziliensis MHOM/BR/75/M2904]CAJ2480709.1 unnamed protein product [Leishmania braziliensis]CAM43631.1 hypothetical protein, unknown function [Leishmania braziliensis MHOM/BR/75/M2904]SYZ69686.1 hypothetical_protein [Leishmania braziliensis MHOM/BR/75/M2904]